MRLSPLLLLLLLSGWFLNAETKLNSLVSEIVNLAPPKARETLRIHRRHSCWLFFRIEGNTENSRLTLDNREILRGSGETMRFVKAGDHQIELVSEAAKRFIVREIPEILLYMLEYRDKKHPDWHFTHSRKFLDKYLLPNCNTVVSRVNPAYAGDAATWHAQGGKWLANQGMRKLRNPENDLAAYWAGILEEPMFDGSLHDEILHKDAFHYEHWQKALPKVFTRPGLADKRVYLWAPWSTFPDTELESIYQLDREQRSSGKFSLRCQSSPKRLTTFRQSQFKLEPGKPYTLSAQMRVCGYPAGKNAPKTTNDGRYTGIFLINTGWFSTCNSRLVPPAKPDTWIRVSRTFRPPASKDGEYELLIAAPNCGELWIDDLRLEAGEKSSTGENLIKNPSFENGWEGWATRRKNYIILRDLVVENDCKLVIEAYRHEHDSLEQAEQKIEEQLLNRLDALKKSGDGFGRNLIVTFSAGNAPLRYSNDIRPDICYKTHLDLQFHRAVNSPAFETIFGLGLWTLHYLDEETARWYGALFRHYLIEGKTTRLASWPYEMHHLRNPGFEAGLEDWECNGNAEAIPWRKAFPGLKRGTYSHIPEKKMVLRTQIRNNASNQIKQTIRNLKPGELYSLRFYVSDAMWSKRTIPVGIELEGTRPVVISAPQLKLWAIRSGKNYWTMHYRVFQATTETATLILDDAPLARLPEKERPDSVFWDFVQVEPYFAE